MEIQVIINGNSTSSFVPIIGERTTELLERLSQKLDADEIEILKKET